VKVNTQANKIIKDETKKNSSQPRLTQLIFETRDLSHEIEIANTKILQSKTLNHPNTKKWIKQNKLKKIAIKRIKTKLDTRK
jgi:hypothetical protein